MMLKALLTENLWRCITFHNSIYWQHPAGILRVQKTNVDHGSLFTG